MELDQLEQVWNTQNASFNIVRQIEKNEDSLKIILFLQ